MRAIFATVLFLIAAVAAAGPTYRWVDAQGQVHYSDRPVEGAQEVQLQSVQSYAPPAIDTTAVASNASTQAAATDDATAPKSVSIVSPTPEQTLWNTGGRLPVAVSVDPALQPGQKVNLYLDGNRVTDGEPGHLAFELSDVFRGEHSLAAAVENAAGTEILRSDTIKFYVQQTSVQAPRHP
jgi:Domain of unknown function (DUF4124)